MKINLLIIREEFEDNDLFLKMLEINFKFALIELIETSKLQ